MKVQILIQRFKKIGHLLTVTKDGILQIWSEAFSLISSFRVRGAHIWNTHGLVREPLPLYPGSEGDPGPEWAHAGVRSLSSLHAKSLLLGPSPSFAVGPRPSRFSSGSRTAPGCPFALGVQQTPHTPAVQRGRHCSPGCQPCPPIPVHGVTVHQGSRVSSLLPFLSLSRPLCPQVLLIQILYLDQAGNCSGCGGSGAPLRT